MSISPNSRLIVLAAFVNFTIIMDMKYWSVDSPPQSQRFVHN